MDYLHVQAPQLRLVPKFYYFYLCMSTDVLFHRFLHVISICFQTELSQMLQALSEKAKAETQFIQQLKSMAEIIPVSILLE